MIRKLTQDDWEQYKDLRLHSLQTDPDVYFSTYEEVKSWSDGSFRSEIFSPPESVFGYLGAFEEARLVGYISLARMYFRKQSHIADVFNLYVHPDFRGNGLARALVTQLIDDARRSDTLEALHLSVMSQNTPAIALYSSVGFTPFGKKIGSIKVNDQYFDELLMSNLLKK